MIPRRIPDLVVAPVMLAAAFAACHALGFRDDVAVLSGTPAAGSAINGVLYVLSWMLAVVVAPILGIAAIVRAAILRAQGVKRAFAPPTAGASQERPRSAS